MMARGRTWAEVSLRTCLREIVDMNVTKKRRRKKKGQRSDKAKLWETKREKLGGTSDFSKARRDCPPRES